MQSKKKTRSRQLRKNAFRSSVWCTTTWGLKTTRSRKCACKRRLRASWWTRGRSSTWAKSRNFGTGSSGWPSCEMIPSIAPRKLTKLISSSQHAGPRKKRRLQFHSMSDYATTVKPSTRTWGWRTGNRRRFLRIKLGILMEFAWLTQAESNYIKNKTKEKPKLKL